MIFMKTPTVRVLSWAFESAFTFVWVTEGSAFFASVYYFFAEWAFKFHITFN